MRRLLAAVAAFTVLLALVADTQAGCRRGHRHHRHHGCCGGYVSGGYVSGCCH